MVSYLSLIYEDNLPFPKSFDTFGIKTHTDKNILTKIHAAQLRLCLAIMVFSNIINIDLAFKIYPYVVCNHPILNICKICWCSCRFKCGEINCRCDTCFNGCQYIEKSISYIELCNEKKNIKNDQFKINQEYYTLSKWKINQNNKMSKLDSILYKLLLALICKRKKYMNFDLAENICKFIDFNIPDINNEAYEYQPMRQSSSLEIYQLIKFNNIPSTCNQYTLDLESDIKTENTLEIINISGRCPYIGLCGYDIKTNSEKRLYYNVQSEELLYITDGVSKSLGVRCAIKYNNNLNMLLFGDDNKSLELRGSYNEISLQIHMKMNGTTKFNNHFCLDYELHEICEIKGPLKYSLIMYNDTEILINEGLGYHLRDYV